MIREAAHNTRNRRLVLHEHPWISLAVIGIIELAMIFLVASIATTFGMPSDTPWRSCTVPTVSHILVLFVLIPFWLKLPNGKTSLRAYLRDIRFLKIRPFIPLLILGLSSSLIMLLLLSSNSVIFRLAEGLPVNWGFLCRAVDPLNDLPPRSPGWLVALPSILEEVLWRGVLLVVFMKKYSRKQAVIITALGFGLFHVINLLFGTDSGFVLRQVIFGSALGFFYGYLVLRTNSLLPAMLFHFLVNLFIGSFTHYFQQYAPDATKIVYTLVTLPLAACVLTIWTRAFCRHWIPLTVTPRS